MTEYLDESGNIVAHYEYDSFGKINRSTGAKAGAFSYQFSTKPLDPITGLHYYGYRWYDAENGRWINRDPIKEDGGMNVYNFCDGDPINHVDVLGLRTARRCANSYRRNGSGWTNGRWTGTKRIRDRKRYAPIDPRTGKPVRQCPNDKRNALAIGKMLQELGHDLGEDIMNRLLNKLLHMPTDDGLKFLKEIQDIVKKGERKKKSPKKKDKKECEIPEPDGAFTADLDKSKTKTRGGHRNAGNKQLNDKMKEDEKFRKKMEELHGDDVFDRTSTSGAGRKNPENTEWDHNTTDKSKLDLRTKENHAIKTRAEGQEGGGFKRHWKKKK